MASVLPGAMPGANAAVTMAPMLPGAMPGANAAVAMASALAGAMPGANVSFGPMPPTTVVAGHGPNAVAAPPVMPVPPAPQIWEQCGLFLLAAAETRNLEFFRLVCYKYAPLLNRDPVFGQLLQEAEVQCFALLSHEVQVLGPPAGALNVIFDAVVVDTGPVPA